MIRAVAHHMNNRGVIAAMLCRRGENFVKKAHLEGRFNITAVKKSCTLTTLSIMIPYMRQVWEPVSSFWFL